jgi:unsaturated rhamnogalacturonyl hydrolase
MGWYAMALVDVLEYIPTRHPGRSRLVDILRDLAKAVVKFRDGDTGLWYQIVDQGGRAGNYLEASASCMFAYCFAKGANNGYLDSTYFGIAREVFRAVTEQFVSVDARGCVDLHGTCRSAGLGGNPYRDGSFAYYISEPKRTNDMKGVGPFLLAAIELERGYLKGTVR